MYKRLLLLLLLMFLIVPVRSEAAEVTFTDLSPTKTTYLRVEDYISNFGKATTEIKDTQSGCQYNSIKTTEPGFLITKNVYVDGEGSYGYVNSALYATDEMTMELQSSTYEGEKRYFVKKGTYYLKTDYSGISIDRMYVLYVPLSKLIQLTKVKESKELYQVYVRVNDQLGVNLYAYITQRKNPDPNVKLDDLYDMEVSDLSNIRITCNGTYYLAIRGEEFSFVKKIKISGLKPIKKVVPVKPTVGYSYLSGECPTGNRVVCEIGHHKYVAKVQANGKYEISTDLFLTSYKYKVKLYYTDLKGTKSKSITFYTKKKGKVME